MLSGLAGNVDTACAAGGSGDSGRGITRESLSLNCIVEGIAKSTKLRILVFYEMPVPVHCRTYSHFYVAE